MLGVVLLAACADPGYRPLTPEAARLGTASAVRAPPLAPRKTPPARGFVLGAPTYLATSDGFALFSPLDGPLEGGRSLVWSTTAGTITPEDGGRATLRTSEATRVEVSLRHRDRTLATSTTLVGGPPLAAAVFGDRIHVATESALTWWDEPPPMEHGTFILERPLVGVRLADGASPWTWLSSSGLPPSGAPTHVPLDPDGCSDPRFPRRAGRLHYGCSDGPNIDRVVRPGRTAAHPLPAEARPAASRAVTGGADLIWVDGEAGRWSGSLQVQPIHGGAFRGRPGGDAGHTVFARADRIEVMPRGESQRMQLPATPLDGADILTVSGRRLAVVEGSVGDSRVRLRRLDDHREAVVARGRDLRAPALTGGHLLFVRDGAPSAIPLWGGPRRTWPLEVTTDAASAVFDDWWVVGVRTPGDGGDLWALHLPSGIAAPFLTAPGVQTPRGAGAGGLTWADRATGTLRTSLAQVRLFEELGSAVVTSGGEARGGGHGGSHLFLQPDATHELSLSDVGPRDELACFRSGGNGTVALRRGGRTIEVPLGSPENGAMPHWQLLPRIGGDPDEPVRVLFRGGREGLEVDALRLRVARTAG